MHTPTKNKLPWTHFFVGANGRVTGFTPDTCETCGEAIQAANSVTMMDKPERLERMGLTRSDTLPPEGYYSDEEGQEACYGCNR